MSKKSNEMAPLLICDISVLAYKNWHKMGSPNYEPEHGREDMEFSQNMYLFMLFLIETLQPHETIFALDSRPNWRDDVYMDYYIENMVLSQKFHLDPNDEGHAVKVFEKEYIGQFDQKTVRYFYSNDAQKWMIKKLLKADIAKIDWDQYIEVAPTEDEIHEAFSDGDGTGMSDDEYKEAIKDMNYAKKKEILYTTLKGLTPAYKGTRSTEAAASKWKMDYATPKNGYKDENGKFIPGFRELSDGIAESLAGTFSAKVIKAPLAEADDIIAHYIKNDKSGRDIILVSVDSDLHHLYLDSLFFKYWNPNIDSEGNSSQYGDFVDLNKTTVLFNLRKKLISGDSSDNIPACGQYDEKLLKKTGEKVLKSTLAGEKTAEKWLTEKKLKEIVPLLEPKSFARNRKLIHLDNIPESIHQGIAKAFKEAKIPEFVDHKEYGASPLKVLTTRQSALFYRGDEKDAEKLDSQIAKAPGITHTVDGKKIELEDMSKEQLIFQVEQLKKENSDLGWLKHPDRMGGQN